MTKREKIQEIHKSLVNDLPEFIPDSSFVSVKGDFEELLVTFRRIIST